MKIDIILEAGLPAGQVEQLGRMAEGYGIQTLWVASFPSRRDPIPAQALLSRCTTRLRLGTLPMSPWEVHPPRIYAGATFNKMLRMAAGVADGTMMSDVPLQRMPEVMGWVGEGLAKSGHQRAGFRMNNFMAWHVKADRAAAIAEARRELIWRGLLMTWFTELFLDPADAAMVEEKRPAFLQAFLGRSSRIEGVPEPVIGKLVENMTLTGDLHDIERIAGHLKALEAAGLDEVALRLHDDPAEGLRLIGERLLPALA